MPLHRILARTLLIGALMALPLLLAAQAPRQQKPDALKRADAAFRAGYAALQGGKLDVALAKFAEAVRLAPQIPEAHEALGAVLVEMGRPAEAVAELEAAVKLEPGDQGFEANLALAEAMAGEPAEAVPHFAAAYTASRQPGKQPVDAAFCEAYARALAATGKPAEAIEIFQAAAEREGGRADLFDDLGSLY